MLGCESTAKLHPRSSCISAAAWGPEAEPPHPELPGHRALRPDLWVSLGHGAMMWQGISLRYGAYDTHTHACRWDPIFWGLGPSCPGGAAPCCVWLGPGGAGKGRGCCCRHRQRLSPAQQHSRAAPSAPRAHCVPGPPCPRQLPRLCPATSHCCPQIPVKPGFSPQMLRSAGPADADPGPRGCDPGRGGVPPPPSTPMGVPGDGCLLQVSEARLGAVGDPAWVSYPGYCWAGAGGAGSWWGRILESFQSISATPGPARSLSPL